MPHLAIKKPVNEIRLIEAPPDLADLFLAWMETGQPFHLYYSLEKAALAYRRTWLIAGPWVFYLSNRDDVIKIRPRSMAYPRWGKL